MESGSAQDAQILVVQLHGFAGSDQLRETFVRRHHSQGVELAVAGVADDVLVAGAQQQRIALLDRHGAATTARRAFAMPHEEKFMRGGALVRRRGAAPGEGLDNVDLLDLVLLTTTEGSALDR